MLKLIGNVWYYGNSNQSLLEDKNRLVCVCESNIYVFWFSATKFVFVGLFDWGQ